MTDDARPLVAGRGGFLDPRLRARHVVDVAVRVDDRVDGRLAVIAAQVLHRARDVPLRGRVDEQDGVVADEGRAIALARREDDALGHLLGRPSIVERGLFLLHAARRLVVELYLLFGHLYVPFVRSAISSGE